jgi:hypothetical protein
MEPGRWQFWQARRKMGAMSLLNVGSAAGAERVVAASNAEITKTRLDIFASFNNATTQIFTKTERCQGSNALGPAMIPSSGVYRPADLPI